MSSTFLRWAYFFLWSS